MKCILLFAMLLVVGDTMKSEVEEILSKRFDDTIRLGSIVKLSDEDRRNLLLRIYIEKPGEGIPKSVIFKQSLPRKRSQEANDEAKIFARFARDWAGLEFLSNLQSDVLAVPQFYGSSIQHKFIIIEDLGENHVSLVDPLTRSDMPSAYKSLKRFMSFMAELHGLTYQKTDQYYKLLDEINPQAEHWQDHLNKLVQKDLPAIQQVLGTLQIAASDEVTCEIEGVYQANITPGPFTALIHGDICPDNLFDNPKTDELQFIDFEWCYVASALLDGTYLRMNFPTCWCSKAIRSDLVPELEAIYRERLGKSIPAAKSDATYNEAYTQACAYWMLKAILLIKDVMEKDSVWPSGQTPPDGNWQPEKNFCRPRVISRLQAFIEVAKAHKKLPHLVTTAESLLQKLALLWPEAKPLEVFPVFTHKEN